MRISEISVYAKSLPTVGGSYAWAAGNAMTVVEDNGRHQP